MSRSTRLPYHATVVHNRGNKKDKQIANRRMRRITKTCIGNVELHKEEFWFDEWDLSWWRYGYEEMEESLPENIREVANVYDFDSDGLARYPSKWLTEEQLSKLTRK